MPHIFHHLLAWHFFTSRTMETNGQRKKYMPRLHLGGQIRGTFFKTIFFLLFSFDFISGIVQFPGYLETCYWAGDLNYCTHFMFTKQTIFWHYFENNLSFSSSLFAVMETQIVLKQRRQKVMQFIFIFFRFYCLNLLSRLTFCRSCLYIGVK